MDSCGSTGTRGLKTWPQASPLAKCKAKRKTLLYKAVFNCPARGPAMDPGMFAAGKYFAPNARRGDYKETK